MSSYYNEEELKALGLRSFGKNVLISRKCSIYGTTNISIGNNVRIDDFCILSGSITLGNYVHISAYNALYGSMGIKISNFCGISPRCTLFSAADDFTGEYMVSPMVPSALSNVTGGLITLADFVQIGAGSIVMPCINIGEGVATGAMSFINEDLESWSIYAGIPAKKIKKRKKNIILLSKEVRNDEF